jgi:hypothetical protein
MIGRSKINEMNERLPDMTTPKETLDVSLS